ncbi:hypothetical protein CLAIMM_01959 [Cladophialophora immunda]|nr:hypothetical protein CLAIMM_01959 [Cladophialophora immunda]
MADSFTTEKTCGEHVELGEEKDNCHGSVPLDSTILADQELLSFDRKMLLKLDLIIIPVVALLFLMSFLDRGNIGNARVAGLQADLHLTDHQYQTALTVTYVPYIVAELPSNLLLSKIGPKILLPTLCTGWGLVTTLQSQVHNYNGLIACRFFLGLLEGGLFPGIVLYLSFFYRRHELQLRVALFFAATSAAGAFSGLLAAAIIQMDGVGGMRGWQWIFCLEGILTFLIGFGSFFLLPNNPRQVHTFTAEQAARCEERLKLDVDLQGHESVDFKSVASAFASVHVWLMVLQLFGAGACLYGLAYFTPSIVTGFGYNETQTQLLTAPPFIAAFIVNLFTAYMSDKYRQRGLAAIGTWIIALVGFVMFYKCRSIGSRYASLFLMITGVYSASPCLVCWVPNNTATRTRRATAIAMAFISTNVGGIVSTWIFPTSQAPYYRFASRFLLSLNVTSLILAAVTIFWLRRRNAEKGETEYRRRVLEPVAGLEPADQLRILGDSHPDYYFTY